MKRDKKKFTKTFHGRGGFCVGQLSGTNISEEQLSVVNVPGGSFPGAGYFPRAKINITLRNLCQYNLFDSTKTKNWIEKKYCHCIRLR